MSQRVALIAGASGAVGKHLLGNLLDNSVYSHIISLVRSPSGIASPKITEKVISFDQLDRLTELDGHEQIDDIYCCLGTTRKQAGSADAFRRVDRDYVVMLGLLAKRFHTQRFAVISSIGAGKSASGLYLKTKSEMEKELKALNLPQLLIFRPSLLQGEREEFRPGEKFANLVMPALTWIPLLNRYQPVSTIRLATAMLKYMTAEEHQKSIQVIESPEIIQA